MQTSKAQNTPSMAELFSDLTNLMRPQVESYQKDLQAAQAITPIDPSILQQAVATGGPLSTAQDFASSSAWAMTPEMFKQTMGSRPDLGRQISEATTLSDAIFGRTASRKAAEGLAAAKFGAAKEATSTAARMREGVLDRTLRAEEGAADRALRESQFSQELSFRKEDAQARRNLERERIDLERKRLMALTAPGSGIDTSKLPLVDREGAVKFDTAARNYLDKSGNIMTGQATNYWNNRLAATALSTNLQSGSMQNIKDYMLSNGQVIDRAVFVRTPYGGEWYGVLGKTKDGKTQITQNPLTVVEHPALRQRSGRSGGQIQAPVYGE